MTAVCSVGMDMVLLPGATAAKTLAAIIADKMAIGVINNKTTATRLIPVLGKKAGEEVVLGGLFGAGPVMPIRSGHAGDDFIARGGQILAPIQSLRN